MLSIWEDLRIHATIILAVIRNLSPATPNNFATSCDKAQLANVDLDDRSLGKNSQLCVHGVLWVLLDANYWELYRDAQFRMCNIRLFVSQTHRSDESFVLDRSTSEVWAHERRFGNHPLPALLRRFFASLYDLEHLLFTNTADLWQGNAKLGSLFGTLVLDGGTQRFRVCGVGSIKQVVGNWIAGLLGGFGGLHVLLLLLSDSLLHLNLLLVSLLLVQLGS